MPWVAQGVLAHLRGRLVAALGLLAGSGVLVRRVRCHDTSIAATELPLVALASRRRVTLHPPVRTLRSAVALVALRLRGVRWLQRFLLYARLLLLGIRRRLLRLASAGAWLLASVLVRGPRSLRHFRLTNLHCLYLELRVPWPSMVTLLVVGVRLSTAGIESRARAGAGVVVYPLLPLMLEAILPASVTRHLVAVKRGQFRVTLGDHAMLPDRRLVGRASYYAAKIGWVADIVADGADNVLLFSHVPLLDEPGRLVGRRHLLVIRAMTHLLFLLLPQSGAQLSVLLELRADLHRVHCTMVSRRATADRGRPVVKYLVADLVRGRSAELLLADLRGVVAMVLGGEGGDVGRDLGCSVAGGAAETLQRDQPSGCGPRLRDVLVGTPVLAEILVTALQHGSQNLRVVAVSLHLHLRLDALIQIHVVPLVEALRALRIVVHVVVPWLQFHILVIIELNIVEGAVAAFDQCWLLRHR